MSFLFLVLIAPVIKPNGRLYVSPPRRISEPWDFSSPTIAKPQGDFIFNGTVLDTHPRWGWDLFFWGCIQPRVKKPWADIRKPVGLGFALAKRRYFKRLRERGQKGKRSSIYFQYHGFEKQFSCY
jgi:hypothetical protein